MPSNLASRQLILKRDASHACVQLRDELPLHFQHACDFALALARARALALAPALALALVASPAAPVPAARALAHIYQQPRLELSR